MGQLTKLKPLLCAFLAFNLSIPTSLADSSNTGSSEIIRWDDFLVPPGFILSTYLSDVRKCTLVWIKQLPEFQKKNPHIEDPDVIPPGAKILVQACRETPVETILPVATESEPVEDNQIVEKIKHTPVLDDYTAGPYFDLYGGLLVENDMDENIDFALGFGLHGDLFSFLGYQIRMLGSSGVAFLNNEIRFKTTPTKPTRYHLIIGMGNRIGLENKDIDRLNKGVDSYTYAGIGLEFRPQMKYRVGMDLTTNINKYFTPNFHAYAQKRLGEDYWLGLFSEFGSSRSNVDDTDKDRRYVTGGLKFSF